MGTLLYRKLYIPDLGVNIGVTIDLDPFFPAEDGGDPGDPGDPGPSTPYRVPTAMTDFWPSANYVLTEADKTFLGKKYDYLMSAKWPTQYRAANPDIKLTKYRVHWAPLQSEWNDLILPWLAANGFDGQEENAILHYAEGQETDVGGVGDGTKTPANRLVTHIWSSARWLANPDDAGWRAYVVSQMLNAVKAAGTDGIFFDEYGNGVIHLQRTDGSAYAESPFSLEIPVKADYKTALVNHLAYLRANKPSDFIIQINTAEYETQFDLDCVAQCDFVHRELDIHSFSPEASSDWTTWETFMALPSTPIVQVTPHLERWLYGPGSTALDPTYIPHYYRSFQKDFGPNAHDGLYRLRMYEFASYWMAKDANGQLVFTPYNYWNDKLSPIAMWLPAYQVDMGAETVARGTLIPASQVYKREFERGIVLLRRQSAWDRNYDSPTGPAVTYDGSGDSRNAPVTVDLSSYGGLYLMRHDGTCETTPRMSIDLLVEEAVFLLKNPAYGLTPTGMQIDQPEATVTAGQSLQLSGRAVGPDGEWMTGAPNTSWSSSDPSVATVDQNGLVTGVSGGTATITLSGYGTPMTCTLTVQDATAGLHTIAADSIDPLPDATPVSEVFDSVQGVNATALEGEEVSYQVDEINGLPAISFNGTTDRLKIPTQHRDVIHWFVVMKRTDGAEHWQPYLISTPAYRLYFDEVQKAVRFASFRSGTSGWWSVSNMSVPGEYELIEVMYDSRDTNNTPVIKKNGQQGVAAVGVAPVGDQNNGAGDMYIGGSEPNTHAYKGFVAEFRSVDPADADTVRAELATKYGITLV